MASRSVTVAACVGVLLLALLVECESAAPVTLWMEKMRLNMLGSIVSIKVRWFRIDPGKTTLTYWLVQPDSSYSPPDPSQLAKAKSKTFQLAGGSLVEEKDGWIVLKLAYKQRFQNSFGYSIVRLRPAPWSESNPDETSMKKFDCIKRLLGDATNVNPHLRSLDQLKEFFMVKCDTRTDKLASSPFCREQQFFKAATYRLYAQEHYKFLALWGEWQRAYNKKRGNSRTKELNSLKGKWTALLQPNNKKSKHVLLGPNDKIDFDKVDDEDINVNIGLGEIDNALQLLSRDDFDSFTQDELPKLLDQVYMMVLNIDPEQYCAKMADDYPAVRCVPYKQQQGCLSAVFGIQV